MFKIFGIAAGLAGVSILFLGKLIGRGPVTYFDGIERYAFGILFLVIGIALFAYGTLKKERLVSDGEKIVACPRCGQAYREQDVIDGKCPSCNVRLEDIRGFYERHPELK